MSLPNLIIGGAPKCGTSSLFKWLADHPEVCGSSIKETFYLMDRDHPLLKKKSNFHDNGLCGYEDYFKHCHDRCQVIFEATTHYIYQKTARDVLSMLPSRPNVIFILRKPSDRIYSSYQYTRNNIANLKKDMSFAEFIYMIKSGATERLSRSFYSPGSAFVLQRDIEYSQYINYISPWVASLGRERVHVFLFEEMRQSPHAFMERLSRCIGIDAAFYTKYDFTSRNETYQVRYKGLQRKAQRFARYFPKEGVGRFLRNMYLSLQDNGQRVAKSQEDCEVLAALEREFEPFNRRLAEVFNLDLSLWD